MVPRDAINVARACAVLVQVQGPDPKGRKMSRHAFFHSESGQTTLSASGLLLLNDSEVDPPRALTVVTCASIVDPFLVQKPSGESVASTTESGKLIAGAKVDILVEVPNAGEQSYCWVPAQLVALLDVPEAGRALQGLLDVHGGSVDGIWDVGWSLAPANEDARGQGLGHQAIVARNSFLERGSAYGEPVSSSTRHRASLGMTATRVAVLSLFTDGNREFVLSLGQVAGRILEILEMYNLKCGLPLATSKTRGDFLLAVGSPFGALSPLHFHNSMSVGFVANELPRRSSAASLLMVDLKCLPGMEGGPVFDDMGRLVGLVSRPLRQRSGHAEVQLVTTSDALLGPLKLAGVNLGFTHVQQEDPVPQRTMENTVEAGTCLGVLPKPVHHVFPPNSMSPAIGSAVSSVVLITIGDAAWASGVLLTENGLILTNAHLLEPWRFVKTRPSQSSIVRGLSWNGEGMPGDVGRNKSEGVSMREEHASCSATHPLCEVSGSASCDCPRGAHKLLEDAPGRILCNKANAEGSPGRTAHASNTRHTDTVHKGNQPIRVRIDDLKLGSCSWHGAKPVCVSQGPLDVALLQLDSVPPNICPITPEKDCPTVGSTAVVIGHGLFGPRSELCPSVSAGVVSRVVKTGAATLNSFSPQESHSDGIPSCAAMLETTAAVHPGGSGGAVVNAEGRMIGLVTSNARHSGGTVIPNLNFSVPCAALSIIFQFAAGNGEDPSILHRLDEPNEQLSAVWALVPPPSKRPSPLIPLPPPSSAGNPSGSPVQKGSRFASFLADKAAKLSINPGPSLESERGLRPHSSNNADHCSTDGRSRSRL